MRTIIRRDRFSLVLGSLLVGLLFAALFTAAHLASPMLRPALRTTDPAWLMLIGVAIVPWSKTAGEAGSAAMFAVARWIARRVIR